MGETFAGCRRDPDFERCGFGVGSAGVGVLSKSSGVSVGVKGSGLSSRDVSLSSISSGGGDSGCSESSGCSDEDSVGIGESGWSVSAGSSFSVTAASTVVFSICRDQEKGQVEAR